MDNLLLSMWTRQLLRRLLSLAVLVAIFSPCTLSLAAADEPAFLYGIHSWGWGAGGLLNGKPGWSVEVVNTDPFPWDPTPTDCQNILNEGFELIIRINKIFGETVPKNSAEWDSFALACAQKVNTFKPYCHIWIIGNEMNADFEGSIPVGDYIEVYGRCRTQIKAVQPQAKILVAPVAPWNPSQSGSGPYPSNRQWLNYMYELVNTLNDDCDGYAIHAYGGRGGDTDPRDDDDWGFGVFKKWLEIIDDNPFGRTKPVYLTEMNHAADGDSTPGFPKYPYPAGYIIKLFEAINDWNKANGFQIKCACWFAHANGGFPGYNISTNSQMADDFKWVTSHTRYYNLESAVTPTLWSHLP